MDNILVFLILIVVAGCSSAPQPPQVSLTGDVETLNFKTVPSRNTVITSQQIPGYWRKQFVYVINDKNPSPEFFYAIAHADKIIANVKPPFIDFIFNKLQSDLRQYGIVTPVELFIAEDNDQKPQVILNCIKFAHEP